MCCDIDIDKYCPAIGKFAKLNENYKQELAEARASYDSAYSAEFECPDEYLGRHCDPELDALDAVVECVPTTLAGVIAMVEHLGAYEQTDGIEDPSRYSALLCNLAEAIADLRKAGA